jgi:predicted transcriptional regulator
MVNIIKGGTGDADVLRGRDVEHELRGVDLDSRTKSILIQLAERTHQNKKAIAELALMFDKMIDNMQGFADIAHNMKERTDRFVKDQEVGERVDEINKPN